MKRIQLRFPPLVLLLFTSQLYTTHASAQWSTDPNISTAICTSSDGQSLPAVASDSASGAIITWMDRRNGTNYDIYAQRINASGLVQWATNGVTISSATGDQSASVVVSDGNGGAIIAWQDYRGGSSSDIYVQRIDASGVVKWTVDGVPVCTATGSQYEPSIVCDGGGGVIITWYDARGGANYDIYAQRVNASGAVQWTENGMPICAASGAQSVPSIVTDGAGGAIIAWRDYRGNSSDIYAQRINAEGIIQWNADGVLICSAFGNQYDPKLVSNGTGGAVVVWRDHRDFSYDIYAQQINASGTVQWMADGVAICTALGYQYLPTVLYDDVGGAIIAWSDARIAGNYDIYAQRVNASGAVQWTLDGIPICTASGYQDRPAITKDNSGGTIITWYDVRGSQADIYAQRVSSTGATQWTSNGVAICTAAKDQYDPAITSRGAGGAIIAWRDYRVNGADGDIYAQQVLASGILGQVAGIASISPTNVELGRVRIGQFRDTTIVIRNTGNDTLKITKIVSSNPVVAVRPASKVLPPSQSFVDTIRFTPAAIGTTNGNIVVTSNSPTSPDTIRISGFGYGQGVVALSTSVISFGKVKVGQFKDTVVTVSNIGNDTLQFQVVYVYGGMFSARPFSGFVLPGKSFNDTIRFSPSTYGTMQATIVMLSNSPSTRDTIRVSGVGLAASLKFNVARMDFGFVLLGKSKDTAVTVLNQGNDTLRISSITCAHPAVTSVTAFLIIPPNGSAIDTFRFAPQTLGSVLGVMLFVNNGLGTYDTLRVMGSGVTTTTGIVQEEISIAFDLKQNHPNPFNPSTIISYSLPKTAIVSLRVFNTLGQEVALLLNEQKEAGYYEAIWNANVPSGIYFYRLQAGEYVETKKMILMK